MTSRAGPRTAPGLRQLLPPPFGPMARLRSDPLGFLLDNHRRFGDVCRFRVGPFVIHSLAHPDHVESVLVAHQKTYPRSWAYERTKIVAGEGRVTTEGQAWRRLRRMAQPAFHHRRVAAMAGLMTDATGAMCGRWREVARRGEDLDVAAEFMDLTLVIAGRTLMGVDLGGEADRFLPERTAGRPRFAWYPFLGGPHQCIGQEFAMMEITLVVAMLARSFRLQLAPCARVEPRPMLSLRPKFGLPMTVRPI